MIKINTTDEKLKMLIESKSSSFESSEELKSYLIKSGEKDFKLTEGLDNQINVLRILKG